MTRCGEFYEKVERDGNFCGLDETAYKRVLAFRDLLKENPTIVGISEGAGRVLISEKDPYIKAKAIVSIIKQVSRGDIPTAKQVKTNLANAREGTDNRGGDHRGGRMQTGHAPTPEIPKTGMTDFFFDNSKDKVPVDGDLALVDEEQDYYTGDAEPTPDEQEKCKAQTPDIAVPTEVSDIADKMKDEQVAQATKDLQKEKENERERKDIAEKNENTKNRDVLVSALIDAMQSALHEGIARKEVFDALHIAIDSVFDPIESSKFASGGAYK